MPYVNNKGADHPAHPHSLISIFLVHCLYSVIPLVSIPEISSLYLASVAVQAGLCLPWSQILKTGFLVTRLIQCYGLSCSMEKQVKDIMHKAFWDVFQERITEDPPDYSQAVVLIREVKEV